MEFQSITLADFIQDVLPSTGHNRNQILTMAVAQEEAVVIKEGRNAGKGKDLLYHNADEHYKITLDSIHAYFALPENPRPKRTLNTQEENAALKAEVAELKKQIGATGSITAPSPTKSLDIKIEDGGTVAKDEIPPKDENIPIKKLSQTDFAAKLRGELKGAKSPSVKAVASASKKDIPKASK